MDDIVYLMFVSRAKSVIRTGFRSWRQRDGPLTTELLTGNRMKVLEHSMMAYLGLFFKAY